MGEVVALPVSEPAGEERPVLVIDLGGRLGRREGDEVAHQPR